MPELTHECGGHTTTSCGPVSSTGFWSKHRDDVSYNQLQKFWSELPLQARHELLRIDKQTLFEQARKNMYCSRCNGLLLEGFMQIIMYGKSLQHEGNRLATSKSQTVRNVCMTIEGNNNDDAIQDPSVHPWGGLTTTRDGTLTLLDCYICSKYLKGLQNVFDSARARERERELLYPDACGGGGRGWISQGMVGYGRGHGIRETCALHTARLSVDTLVDFWSALGEDTRFSLLRMKEEDFMERLMYRFDSKRFCRDCRKNVIREFKELKELKRLRKETHCTSWFCVADTSFQCELTLDTIQVTWHQNYADSNGIYKHYEWAVGTGEGKSDIRGYENVDLKSRVKVNEPKLAGLNSCYITLRARRTDGVSNEVSVKAHALKGQDCVHGRLGVGDGFVTISRGDNIRSFFEHAEEAEEEEDDESVDRDGNELDGECSRPQKHAKSPELAREFLLDAATIIFKEQVEKAFREGTARQNAHSMFVSLALKLLEKRVIVACKDIITLEKQFKLLEEEEKEKRDEEERKERRRVKEKEKKLRRKERLRIKEQKNDKKCGQPSKTSVLDHGKEELTSVNNDHDINDNACYEEQQEEEHEDTEDTPSFMPASDDYNTREDQLFDYDEKSKDGNQLFANNDQLKHNRRRPKSWKDYQHDQPSKWSDRRRFDYGSTVNKPAPRYHSDGFETSRNGNLNGVNKPVSRSNVSRYNDRSHCCQQTYYRPKLGAPEPDTDTSKPYSRRNKYYNIINNNNQAESVRERPKTKMISGNTKKVWEPRSNLDSADVVDPSADVIKPVKLMNSPNAPDLDVTNVKDNDLKASKSNIHIEPGLEPESGTTDLSTSTDSCSSSLSEGDGNTSFSSNPQNAESPSTSDSEYANHLAEMVKENASELLSETTESVTGNNISNIMPPPLQAQSIHFPVFQPPSMGYYHQGPVPWTTGPPNGLVPLGPLSHPNHYMFASPSPFGYGNSRYVQYGVGGLHPPPLNHGQLPMYQAVPPVNVTIPIIGEHVNPGMAQNGDNENESWDKTQKGNPGFSLFHFGGPVDVSNGFNPDTSCVKEEVDVSVDGCGVVKDVEEYNLFAASNGIQFSIF